MNSGFGVATFDLLLSVVVCFLRFCFKLTGVMKLIVLLVLFAIGWGLSFTMDQFKSFRLCFFRPVYTFA